MHSLYAVTLLILLMNEFHICICSSVPFQMITKEGSLRSEKVLSSYFPARNTDGNQGSIVGVVQFCPEEASNFINKVFETNFEPDINGS
jgi:hypothetical protein